MFASRISAEVTKKLLGTGRLEANMSPWSYDMEGHAKKWVERYCELGEFPIRTLLSKKKTTQQFSKVSILCVDDHQKIGLKEAEHRSHVEILMKHVDSGEPTSFFDHVYLGCTRRECKTNDNVDN